MTRGEEPLTNKISSSGLAVVSHKVAINGMYVMNHSFHRSNKFSTHQPAVQFQDLRRFPDSDNKASLSVQWILPWRRSRLI